MTEEQVLCAYGIYCLIGIIVSTIVDGAPLQDGEPWDDSIPKRIGVAIWWPFAIVSLFLKKREG